MWFHFVTPVLNTKYLILFQFITHLIRAFMPTTGCVREVGSVTMGTLVKAAVLMVKVRHTFPRLYFMFGNSLKV